MFELRWIHKTGAPKAGWISIGTVGHGPLLWQVLQYRARTNPIEEGLQEATYTEWQDVEFGA
jgi:hypothetical protein